MTTDTQQEPSGDGSPAPPGERGAAALTYSSYLGLDLVLGAQRPLSGEHDEMLFIVVHQVYELWFKEILHELAHLQERLEADDTSHALHTLKRILTILKVAVAQIDVLETMTPRQFTSFRGRLDESSGFQSAQFREIEAVLGKRDRRVLRNYADDHPQRRRIVDALERPSLYDSFLRYLKAQGYDVPPEILERDFSRAHEPSPEIQDVLIQAYKDDGGSAQVCERLVDLDEGLLEWRYRHVKMVQRTIGDKRGTGGSPGAAYLQTTLDSSMFPDLWAVRSAL